MPKKILRAAAVLYFILAGYWLLIGLVLAIAGLVENTLSSMLSAIWDTCVAYAYVAIGVGLVYQAPRAKDWGLWSAVVSAPLVLITGGINVLLVIAAFLYLIIIVLLVAERVMTRPRPSQDGDVLPSGKPSRWRD